jgi:hypothetical protein
MDKPMRPETITVSRNAVSESAPETPLCRDDAAATIASMRAMAKLHVPKRAHIEDCIAEGRR